MLILEVYFIIYNEHFIGNRYDGEEQLKEYKSLRKTRKYPSRLSYLFFSKNPSIL